MFVFLSNFELFENDTLLIEELKHNDRVIRIYNSPSNATIERAIVIMLKEVEGETLLTHFKRFDLVKDYKFISPDTLRVTLEDTLFNKGRYVERKIYIPN